MRIICDYCLTEYQVEPPPKPDDGPSRFSFRCSNCGRVFSAEHQNVTAQVSAALTDDVPAVERPQESPPSTSNTSTSDILVKQGDQTYSADNMSLVQRWIVERRLNRSAQISHDGLTWKSLNDLPEVQAFLDIVEQVQSLEVPVPNNTAADDLSQEQSAPIQNESSFVDVAELEATIDFEPENTQDELDNDPFPTDEVPLPTTPIVSNLRDMEIPNFSAPATEETPFDYPIVDESTLEAPKIELPSEPSLPSLANAQDMIEAPGPSFAEDEHPDFPTEEELTLFDDEVPSQSQSNEPLFSDVEADWDNDFEEELAWVSDKKKTRRIALGLILLILCAFTGKMLSEKMGTPKETQGAENPSSTTPQNPVSTAQSQGEEQENSVVDSIDGEQKNTTTTTQPDEKPTKKEPKVEVTSTPIPKPKAKKANAVVVAPKSNTKSLQRKASATARKENAKRGPKATTAADHMDRGRQALTQGKFNEARIHYLEAVALEPKNPEAVHGLAFAAHGQNDISFATNKYCEALGLSNPSSAVAKETRKKLSELKADCK